jgi:hypothetical protein
MKRSTNSRISELGRKIPQIRMGVIQAKMVQIHEPSSQPSQLNAKCARKIKIKTQNPKLRKFRKNLEKSHTLSLI